MGHGELHDPFECGAANSKHWPSWTWPGSQCCTVALRSGIGNYCQPVPIWDITTVFSGSSGSSSLQSFFYGLTYPTLCGWVRHNFEDRFAANPSLDLMDNALTTLTDGTYTLTRVGTYIDQGCAGWTASPPPFPYPPPAAGGGGASAAPPPTASSSAPAGASSGAPPPPLLSPPTSAGGGQTGGGAGAGEAGGGGMGAGMTVLVVVMVSLLLLCLLWLGLVAWKRYQGGADAGTARREEAGGAKISPGAGGVIARRPGGRSEAVATGDVQLALDSPSCSTTIAATTKAASPSSSMVDDRVRRARRDNRAHGHVALHKNSVLAPGMEARILAAAASAGETRTERGELASPPAPLPAPPVSPPAPLGAGGEGGVPGGGGGGGEEEDSHDGSEVGVSRARARARASAREAARANALGSSDYLRTPSGEGAEAEAEAEAAAAEAEAETETEAAAEEAEAEAEGRRRARGRASVREAARANASSSTYLADGGEASTGHPPGHHTGNPSVRALSTRESSMSLPAAAVQLDGGDDDDDDGSAREEEVVVVVAARASISSAAAALPQWRARARARASVVAAARANGLGQSGYMAGESSREEVE